MEGVICEFCDKSFKSISILRNHKQTAKYCLKIQKEKNPENVKENFKKCNFCLKSFAYNVIKRHVDKCKIKSERDNEDIDSNTNKEYLDIIKELEIENKNLKEDVKELTDKLNELSKNNLQRKRNKNLL